MVKKSFLFNVGRVTFHVFGGPSYSFSPVLGSVIVLSVAVVNLLCTSVCINILLVRKENTGINSCTNLNLC